jgi:hypothetical protein
MIERAGVHPDARCSPRERVLDRTAEERATETLADEFWREAKVGDLDLVRFFCSS